MSLAAGAAPAMVIGLEEAPEFAAKKATALSINCGADDGALGSVT